MKAELQQLERYLRDALGVEVAAVPWRDAGRLPQFLRERYDFAQATLLGVPCLFVIDAIPTEATPAVVHKHLELLRDKQDAEVVYVRPQVTAYNRKRLIERKVPFIVPGNQMYLPMLAIDLREYFRRIRTASESAAFSPATQAVVIHAMLHRIMDELVPLDMARRLGYSAMTMSRAFDELEAAHIGQATIRGRERRLRLAATGQELWAQAQPFLRSPVNKRLTIPRYAPLVGIGAGLTALAHYSMLAPPEWPTLAVSREQWKKFRRGHTVTPLPTADPDGMEIEVWSYPPSLFAQKNFVDPFSLYLSLKHEQDERTQAALDEMVAGYCLG